MNPSIREITAAAAAAKRTFRVPPGTVSTRMLAQRLGMKPPTIRYYLRGLIPQNGKRYSLTEGTARELEKHIRSRCWSKHRQG